MLPLSRSEADDIIDKISRKNGGLPDELRRRTDPEVLEVLEGVRQQLGEATRTLATQLYTKDTRFVYELIQNAEDNTYSTANGGPPYLSFSVFPDRIEVDSNEDGFNKANVQALCSIGKSTKARQDGYIGEKGIGFKSVFKIANKVHVQSGSFSFTFRHSHDSDSSGMGMVTPFHEPHKDLPATVRTRIVLSLANTSILSLRLRDLLEIRGDLLLFLAKLKRITIRNHLNPVATSTTIYTYHEDDRQKNVCSISRTTGTIRDEKTFFIIKREVNSLPRHEARPNTTKTTVVLAFPIDKHGNPSLETQYVFAYLPLRNFGFQFLIQADFITQASREDVLVCPWNQRLLDEVALTFRDAVKAFNNHPVLKYCWMQYLPDENIHDDFWRLLRGKILEYLKHECIFWSRGGRLCDAAVLRQLTPKERDGSGQPLLEPSGIFYDYCSSAYRLEIVLQRDLGLRQLDPITTLQMIESQPSVMQKDDNDWQSRMAELLQQFYLGSPQSLKTFLERLPLIPRKETGILVSIADADMYFPKTQGSHVPRSLGYDLVDDSVELVPERYRLLGMLGVKTATPAAVISKIYEIHSGKHYKKMSVQSLRFLYEQLPVDATTLKTPFFLWDGAARITWVSGSEKRHIYFSDTEDSLGLFKALADIVPKPPEQARFLNKRLAEYPGNRLIHGRTYRQWLTQVVGIDDFFQIVHYSGMRLSDEFKLIVKHAPDKILDALRLYWGRRRTGTSKEVVAEIGNCPVLLEASASDTLPLRETFLPLPKLRHFTDSLGLTCPSFFLKMPSIFIFEENWQFLGDFGVGIQDNLSFYLKSLIEAQEKNLRCPMHAMRKVYSKLANYTVNSECQRQVKNSFDGKSLIFTSGGHNPILGEGRVCTLWERLENCVWSGPDWLKAKYVVKSHYPGLEVFFQQVLKVADFTWTDCLEEIESIISSGCIDRSEALLDAYKWLMQDFTHHTSHDMLREEIEKRKLIFCPDHKTRHSPSSCVWAESDVKIPEKQSIATYYGGLEDFFIKMLGVKKPSVKMHAEALKALASSRTKDADWYGKIKDAMLTISQMRPNTDELSILRSSNIFMVRTRLGTRPTSSQVEFIIVDHPHYNGLFPDAHTLDFTLDEVRQCRPFLMAMGLRKNHISHMIVEKTTVEGGAVDNRLTKWMNNRAYALFRLAVHYNSTKAREDNRSLLTMLETSETLSSDDIYQTRSIIQNSQTHEAPRSKALLHLDESTTKLRIYIPKNNRDWEICRLRYLPKRLMELFGISELAAETVLANVVQSSSLDIVDEILDAAGILPIQGVSRSEDTFDNGGQDTDREATTYDEPVRAEEIQQGTLGSGSHGRNASRTESWPRSASPALSQASTVVSRPILAAREFTNSSSPFSPNQNLLLRTGAMTLGESLGRNESHEFAFQVPHSFTISPPDFNLPAQENASYIATLDRMINGAATMELPEFDDASYALAALTETNTFQGLRTLDRDRKVGAAGELLAFEFFSSLGLAGFNIGNWRSTIRKEVKVHPKYRVTAHAET